MADDDKQSMRWSDDQTTEKEPKTLEETGKFLKDVEALAKSHLISFQRTAMTWFKDHERNCTKQDVLDAISHGIDGWKFPEAGDE